MTGFGLDFHHLGLAVRRPDEATAFLSGLGYLTGERIFDPQQNVNVVFCHHPHMPSIEIIYPGSTPGPIDKFVERHASGIVYHMCFETADLQATLGAIEAAQLRPLCISEPRPAVLLGGRLVSFYNVVGMGLIEIIER